MGFSSLFVTFGKLESRFRADRLFARSAPKRIAMFLRTIQRENTLSPEFNFSSIAFLQGGRIGHFPDLSGAGKAGHWTTESACLKLLTGELHPVQQ